MKVLLIYNSHAGNKRAAKLLPDVLKYFEQKRIETELFLTENCLAAQPVSLECLHKDTKIFA